jgi:hypothetical protein
MFYVQKLFKKLLFCFYTQKYTFTLRGFCQSTDLERRVCPLLRMSTIDAQPTDTH